MDMFILFCLVFIFKQTFGIPGALLLNILGGRLYGILALPLICTLAAIGSALMYGLSKHILGHVIFGVCVPITSVASLKSKIDEHRNHMLLFLTSIGAVPFIPGWFINVASPFVGVPIDTFFLSTWIGFYD